MMTDQQKIIIDEELKKIGAKLDNYDDFIEYCKNRGILGSDAVGMPVKSVTNHIFYVKHDIAPQFEAALSCVGDIKKA